MYLAKESEDYFMANREEIRNLETIPVGVCFCYLLS